MSEHRLIACLAVCTIVVLLIPIGSVAGQNYYEYKVQVRSDGSAVWTITYFSSADAIVVSWEDFQDRIFNLVDSAANVTHPTMDIDEESLQMDSTISSGSKLTVYTFRWQNFSTATETELTVGDVFQVHDFFSQLFGEAAIELTYPDEFTIKSATPPYQQDSPNSMRWPRTQDLSTNYVNIILTSNNQDLGVNGGWQQYIPLIVVSAAAATLGIVGYFIIKRRRSTGRTNAVPSENSAIETEEDKVVKLLTSSGGSLRQSEITERCRFSKAKTSQLLTSLESRGILTRYKKGRDKIVVLKERVKGEKQ